MSWSTLLAVVGLLGASQVLPVAAPGHHSPSPGCVTPAPPPATSTPTPDAQPPSTTPETPSTSPGELGTGAGESGSGALASAPNMFGDTFGGRGLTVVIPRPAVVIPGTPGTPARSTVIGGFFLDPASGQRTNFPIVTNNFGQTIFLVAPNGGPPAIVFGRQITENFVASGPLQAGRFPLAANTQNQNAALTFAIAQLGPGGTLTYLANPNASFAEPVPSIPGIRVANLATRFLYTLPAIPGTPDQVIPQAPFVLDIPSPTGGGVVGRTKVAEDNNPLPRDRVFFGYDYYSNVPLSASGVGVHRFAPGFERTFFDQNASIELRVPFASTLSGDVLADGVTNSGQAVFGNVHLTLKGLLVAGNTLNVSAGLGVALPTSADTRVFLPDGTEVVAVKNDAVLLTPYVAALYTPDDRLFVQGWLQFPFDTNGNRVFANPDLTSLRQFGRLNDQTLMQIDVQLGYWLYRSEAADALVRGVAPFAELHWNSTLSNADVLTAGAFTIGDLRNRFDELNLSVGWVTQVRDNFLLQVGAVFPLRGGENRPFDYQVGIRGSLFFGPTARSASAARLAPSSY